MIFSAFYACVIIIRFTSALEWKPHFQLERDFCALEKTFIALVTICTYEGDASCVSIY